MAEIRFSNQRLAALREKVCDAFDEEELRTLVFDLGLEYDDLPRSSKTSRARGLVGLLHRSNRIPDLIDYCKKERPEVAWDEPVPEPAGPPPFKGLQHYQIGDASLFFGRDKLTARLVQDLEKHDFLAVVGDSGSGKSSLVRAGVLAALGAEEPTPGRVLLPAGSTNRPVLFIRPDKHPLESLAVQFTGQESAVATEALRKEFRELPSALHLRVRKQLDGRGNRKHLLVVDPFEALFTACGDEAERRSFIDNLLYATDPETGGSISVIIAMRADFYQHCASYPGLRAALEKHQAYIGPMTQAELEEVITQPARDRGVEFETGLVEILLREVQDQPGHLPLLEDALLELWNGRSGPQLTCAAYVGMGGVAGALEKRAESVYKTLSEDQKKICRHVFRRLVQLRDDAEATRRRALLRDLLPAGCTPQLSRDIESMAWRLATQDARLITIESDRKDRGEQCFELSHEVLIRRWPRFQTWIAEDRATLRLEYELDMAARAWRERPTEQDEREYLWQGMRLSAVEEASAQKQIELSQAEDDFVKASIASRDKKATEEKERAAKEMALTRRQNRLLRVGVALLGVVLVLLLVLGRQAVAVFSTADRQALAESQREAFESLHLLAEDPAASARLALVALPGPTPHPYVPEAELALAGAVRANVQDGYLQLHDPSDRAHVHFDQAGIALGAESGRVAAYDAGLQVFEGNHGQEAVMGVAWHGDSRVLLSYSDDSVRVWRDGVAWGEKYIAPAEEGKIKCASWRPQSVRLEMAICQEHVLYLWSPAGGTALALTAPLTDTLKGAYWDEDGKQLVITTVGDGNLTVRPLELSAAAGGVTAAIAAGADGAGFVAQGRFVAWRRGSRAELWSIAGARLDTLVGDEDPANDVWFLGDGRMLAATQLQSPALWEWDEGQRTMVVTARLEGSPKLITAAAWGDRYLATGGTDGAIHVWDLQAGDGMKQVSAVMTLRGHKPPPDSPRADVKALRWLDQGRLASYGQDGSLRLWQVFDEQGEPFCTGMDNDGVLLCTRLSTKLPLPQDRRYEAAFWLDERTIMAVDDSGTGWRWSPGEREARALSLYPGGAVAVERQPGQPFLLVYDALAEAGGPGGTVWDLDREVRVPSPPGPIAGALWSDMGLILTAESGPARLWDIASGSMTQLPGPTGEQTALHAASSYGDRLALGWLDGSLDVWDRRSGRIVHSYTERREEDRFSITNLEWSADGGLLLSVGCQVRLWDAERWTEPVPLLGAADAGCSNISATLSRDDRYVAASVEGELTLFDVATGRELPAARAIHNDTVTDIRWLSGAAWPYPERERSWQNTLLERLTSAPAYAARDWILATRSGRTARLWRWDPQMKSLKEIWRVSTPGDISMMDAGPSGIVTLEVDGSVRVWTHWARDPAGLLAEAAKVPALGTQELAGVPE